MKSLLLNIGKNSKRAFYSQLNSKKKDKVLKDYYQLLNKKKKIIINKKKKNIKNNVKKK